MLEHRALVRKYHGMKMDSGQVPDQGGHVYYVREFILSPISNIGPLKECKKWNKAIRVKFS